MAPRKDPGKLYSVKQIHELFLPGLSRRKISLMLELGEIESYRVGKKRLIAERDIKIYISKLIPEERPEQQGRMGVGR